MAYPRLSGHDWQLPADDVDVYKRQLYGDGCDASSEQLIRTALRIRKQYLPGMSITFVEIGSGQGQNVAKHMAARQDMMYLE